MITGIKITPRRLPLAAAFTLAAACGAPPSGPQVVTDDPSGAPIAGLTSEQTLQHHRGDTLFEVGFLESQGLGPLYVRPSCGSCHADDSRGPGAVTRMAIVEADGFTPVMDQSALLPFGSASRPQLAAGATQPILPPDNAPGLLLSRRIGPPVFGRGWIDAVDDAEILRVADEQARDGRVSGRVNRLADGTIGRFGVKARLDTLERFTADAFRGDMSMTSPIFPEELPNPDGLTDDRKPGVDLSMETVDDVAFYVRTLAIPRRDGLTDEGRALFERVGCATCHVPDLGTRADATPSQFASARAEIYSDLLVHDLGPALADGIVDGSASSREWRTAPLMGLRFFRNYLHDGRAHSVEDAVHAHRDGGSEANFAVDAFDALSDADRAALLDFIQKL